MHEQVSGDARGDESEQAVCVRRVGALEEVIDAPARVVEFDVARAVHKPQREDLQARVVGRRHCVGRRLRDVHGHVGGRVGRGHGAAGRREGRLDGVGEGGQCARVESHELAERAGHVVGAVATLREREGAVREEGARCVPNVDRKVLVATDALESVGMNIR